MAKSMEQKLLTNFNQITGLLLRGSNPYNIDKMTNLRKMFKNDDDMIRNFMEDWYEEHPNPSADTAMVQFYGYALRLCGKAVPKHKTWVNGKRTVETPKATPTPKPEPPVETPKPEPKEEVKPVAQSAEAQAAGLFSGITELVGKYVIEQKATEIEEKVTATAITRLEKFIHDNYEELPKKVIIEMGAETREVKGITHAKFESTLKKVARHTPVFLVGGAGSGKNVLAEQIAEALGVPFYFSSAVSQEYKITGYSDANGIFSSPPFYKAWTEGGVFLFDEIDASNPEVFVTFNSALSNGYMDFPAPIGNVKKSDKFYAMAAGNTYGTGADYQYVGRNVLDAATRNRFYVMEIGYDERIEKSICGDDLDLFNFCHQFRRVTARNGIQAIFSYRNLHMLKDAENDGDPLYEVIDGALTSGMRYDDLNIINNELSGCGRWGTAFRELVSWKKGMVMA